ncbi:hypothetical protein IJS18_01650 [Candidatus Saccharibacteria bacterium]|nr:hypothetical protein [Candidatus Saccharibacteria bacterium]
MENGFEKLSNETKDAPTGWESVAEMADQMTPPAERPTQVETEKPETKAGITGADLIKGFSKNRADIESYVEETTGGKVEEFAPHLSSDEAYFDQALKDLAGEGKTKRKPEEIASDEIVKYYADDLQKQRGHYNEMNEAIHQKYQSLGFFGKHLKLGKGAKELKAMQAEQNSVWEDVQKAEHRFNRLQSMIK